MMQKLKILDALMLEHLTKNYKILWLGMEIPKYVGLVDPTTNILKVCMLLKNE